MTADPRAWLPPIFGWLGNLKPELKLFLVAIVIHAAGMVWTVMYVFPQLIEQIHAGYVEILERVEILEDRRQESLRVMLEAFQQQAAEHRAFNREMEMRRSR